MAGAPPVGAARQREFDHGQSNRAGVGRDCSRLYRRDRHGAGYAARQERKGSNRRGPRAGEPAADGPPNSQTLLGYGFGSVLVPRLLWFFRSVERPDRARHGRRHLHHSAHRSRGRRRLPRRGSHGPGMQARERAPRPDLHSRRDLEGRPGLCGHSAEPTAANDRGLLYRECGQRSALPGLSGSQRRLRVLVQTIRRRRKTRSPRRRRRRTVTVVVIFPTERISVETVEG
jgi:hypothetical protein